MEYIKVEDGVITEILSSSHNLENDGYQKVELTNDVNVGEPVNAYDDNWNLRPISDLIKDGIVELKKSTGERDIPEGVVIEKLVDGKIIPKSRYDLITEGSIEKTEYEIVDHENKITYDTESIEELLETNSISQERANELKSNAARAKRNKLLLEVDRVVSNPLRWEEISSNDKDKLRMYRKILLDITDQAGFPWNIKWPIKPSIIE